MKNAIILCLPSLLFGRTTDKSGEAAAALISFREVMADLGDWGCLNLTSGLTLVGNFEDGGLLFKEAGEHSLDEVVVVLVALELASDSTLFDALKLMLLNVWRERVKTVRAPRITFCLLAFMFFYYPYPLTQSSYVLMQRDSRFGFSLIFALRKLLEKWDFLGTLYAWFLAVFGRFFGLKINRKRSFSYLCMSKSATRLNGKGWSFLAESGYFLAWNSWPFNDVFICGFCEQKYFHTTYIYTFFFWLWMKSRNYLYISWKIKATFQNKKLKPCMQNNPGQTKTELFQHIK